MKRFQECNWIVKLWRYRHYCYVPFKWLYNTIKGMEIPETEYDDELCMVTTNGKSHIPKGFELWRILIGAAQCDMNWTYTMEEVMGKLKEKRPHFKSDWDSGCHRDPIDHGDVDEY